MFFCFCFFFTGRQIVARGLTNTHNPSRIMGENPHKTMICDLSVTQIYRDQARRLTGGYVWFFSPHIYTCCSLRVAAHARPAEAGTVCLSAAAAKKKLSNPANRPALLIKSVVISAPPAPAPSIAPPPRDVLRCN